MQEQLLAGHGAASWLEAGVEERPHQPKSAPARVPSAYPRGCWTWPRRAAANAPALAAQPPREVLQTGRKRPPLQLGGRGETPGGGRAGRRGVGDVRACNGGCGDGVSSAHQPTGTGMGTAGARSRAGSASQGSGDRATGMETARGGRFNNQCLHPGLVLLSPPRGPKVRATPCAFGAAETGLPRGGRKQPRRNREQHRALKPTFFL